MKKDKYICPVCGFPELNEPPFGVSSEPSYEICSCCGFEFGFDCGDDKQTFAKFRQNWLAHGAPWFMPGLKPIGWDVEKQLGNL
jgi:hypothetical protein